MTNGDGLNKRAPGQSLLSKVVVEVLESIVRVDSRFSLTESHFACLAPCRGTQDSRC